MCRACLDNAGAALPMGRLEQAEQRAGGRMEGGAEKKQGRGGGSKSVHLHVCVSVSVSFACLFMAVHAQVRIYKHVDLVHSPVNTKHTFSSYPV